MKEIKTRRNKESHAMTTQYRKRGYPASQRWLFEETWLNALRLTEIYLAAKKS